MKKIEGQAPLLWPETKRAGQVMVISVVTLGGILLASAGIAGLITFYQIRSANEAVGSAKALFAADAGIEAASFCYFRGGCDPEIEGSSPALEFNDPQVSANSTSLLTPESLTITTRGFAARGRIIRILEATFTASSP